MFCKEVALQTKHYICGIILQVRRHALAMQLLTKESPHPSLLTIGALAFVLGSIAPIAVDAEIIPVQSEASSSAVTAPPTPDCAARISAEHCQVGAGLPARLHRCSRLQLHSALNWRLLQRMAGL